VRLLLLLLNRKPQACDPLSCAWLTRALWSGVLGFAVQGSGCALPRPGALGGALVMPRKTWSGPVRLPPPKFPGVAMGSCLMEMQDLFLWPACRRSVVGPCRARRRRTGRARGAPPRAPGRAGFFPPAKKEIPPGSGSALCWVFSVCVGSGSALDLLCVGSRRGVGGAGGGVGRGATDCLCECGRRGQFAMHGGAPEASLASSLFLPSSPRGGRRFNFVSQWKGLFPTAGQKANSSVCRGLSTQGYFCLEIVAYYGVLAPYTPPLDSGARQGWFAKQNVTKG
jgi:hypothetical protein